MRTVEPSIAPVLVRCLRDRLNVKVLSSVVLHSCVRLSTITDDVHATNQLDHTSEQHKCSRVAVCGNRGQYIFSADCVLAVTWLDFDQCVSGVVASQSKTGKLAKRWD